MRGSFPKVSVSGVIRPYYIRGGITPDFKGKLPRITPNYPRVKWGKLPWFTPDRVSETTPNYPAFGR